MTYLRIGKNDILAVKSFDLTTFKTHMKTNLRLFTFVVMGMLVATSAFAQKASDFKNSKAIIDKAIEYHDDEKYEKAIALYDLINRTIHYT